MSTRLAVQNKTTEKGFINKLNTVKGDPMCASIFVANICAAMLKKFEHHYV